MATYYKSCSLTCFLFKHKLKTCSPVPTIELGSWHNDKPNILFPNFLSRWQEQELKGKINNTNNVFLKRFQPSQEGQRSLVKEETLGLLEMTNQLKRMEDIWAKKNLWGGSLMVKCLTSTENQKWFYTGSTAILVLKTNYEDIVLIFLVCCPDTVGV